MVIKILNAKNVMNMVIMHPSALKEKINIKEDLDQEDPRTACMLMKKKKSEN